MQCDRSVVQRDEASQVIIHVRMLDTDAQVQQIVDYIITLGANPSTAP